MSNRLAGESSPYLLLHKDNPVDWYPWGEEALERAREEDKPIFLSVGYSTCYWCHVMERESFSDPQTAELMNERFVNVKVDREERPEIDEIYMVATQLLTGHGGWPNSVFLTPALKPFYAGTYFPPQDRHGLPGFRTVLRQLAGAWESRRKDVEMQADEMESAMRRFLEERGRPAAAAPPAVVAERSLEALGRRFDPEWGGFGGAPKFPTPANLHLLLAFAAERPEAGRMLAISLDRMARGGLYDQLGGGFHRYATDREWKIPHFEKMLYDNGQLLEVYACHHAASGDPEAARVVRGTADFLERELSAPEGGFWSALDAQTGGHEGRYYVWTRDELEEALGEDAVFLAPVFGFDGPPFFEGEHYVLHLPRRAEELAGERGVSREELWERVEPLRRKLLEAREGREKPLVDDKVLADWNGMAVAGLATAGRVLGEEAMVERAGRCADFVLREMRREGGPLLHSWRRVEAKRPAHLADYAFFVRGLLALHRATEEPRWLAAARELTGEQIERLGDPEGGFYAAAEAPDVLVRSKEVFDGALPSANAVAVLDLLELAEATGETRWREEAERALRAFARFIEQQPEGARMLALASRRFDAGAEGGAEEAPQAGGSGPEEEALRAVSTELATGEPAGEGGVPFTLRLEIADGWHLHAHRPGPDWAPPTALDAAGAELRSVRYPEGEPERLAEGGDELRTYRGRVEIEGELEPGRGGEPKLLLTYQACESTRCLPEVTVEIPLEG